MSKKMTKEQRDLEFVKARLMGQTSCAGCQYLYDQQFEDGGSYSNNQRTLCAKRRTDPEIKNPETSRCRYFLQDLTPQYNKRRVIVWYLDTMSMTGVRQIHSSVRATIVKHSERNRPEGWVPHELEK